MELMQELDPEGVARRKRRRLKRKVCTSPGSDFCWHVDGLVFVMPTV